MTSLPFGVFLAVLGAALLHAGWNAIIKTGLSKQTSMFLLSVGHALIGIVVAFNKPFPAPDVWPWLFASGLIHMAYQLFLAFAYEQGDLSRVYPIARGTAPLMVMLVSLVFLSEPMRGVDYLGIFVLGLGITFMARGVFSNGESRRLLPFAFGSALATAGYTLADGLGARVAGDPLQYVGWLMILSACFYTPAAIALKGVAVIRASRKDWFLGMVAAAASFAAYAIAVWGMTVAPLALVAALRETSILFAVLLGWLLFGDRMDRGKVIAAVLIVTGIVLTRL